jgi:rsbT co-antagonist protein RsbR
VASKTTFIADMIKKNQGELLDKWTTAQRAALSVRGRKDSDVPEQSQRFVAALLSGLESEQFEDITGRVWEPARDVLAELSRTQATRGATPTETATFVFALKEPLFQLLRRECGKDADRLANETWTATLLLDKLGLFTTEIFQKSREEVIVRQQEEMLELSTPVVQLWEGILALPLIGTLDSSRTQVVMENLLQEIVRTEAEIAIVDITGVPTVDTLVAQHLLKTVSAARLMGADCIISGIRPQIAQTIVHLGVELNVVSKATMADAFAVALRRIGKRVVDRAKAKPALEIASVTQDEE